MEVIAIACRNLITMVPPYLLKIHVSIVNSKGLTNTKSTSKEFYEVKGFLGNIASRVN